ncbi:PKD-like domain-containing protein, partial [Lutibacter sp. B1]|uniref:PKD-like domain-containing protein n=1 Tax=Lutibacter sp. B1 TaxID=2725996 RepID=UPI001457952F
VNPTPTISSAATKTICDSTDLDYDITSATTGTTFTWTVSETTAPTGGSITGFTADATGTNSSINDVLVNSGTSPGEVTYTITPTGPATTNCPGIPFDLVVTVNPDPILTATPDVATFCSGGTTSIALSSTTSGVTYYYDAPIISGSAGNITGGTARTSPGNTNDITDTLVNTTAEIQTATYTVYAMYDGCVSSTPETVVITVNPVPVLTTGLTEGLCVDNLYTATANLDLTTSPSMAGALFTYGAPTLSGGAGDLTGGTARTTASSDNITDTFINTTDIAQTATYSVTPIAPSDLGGCSGEPKTVVITIYPRSEITSSLAEVTCSQSEFTYAVTSNVTNSTFTWSRAAVTNISNSSTTGTGNVTETLINTTTAPVDVTYVLTPTGPSPNNCTGTPSDLIVTVNPTGQVNKPTDQELCNNDNTTLITFTTNNTGGTTTYSWVNDTPSIGLAASGTNQSTIPVFTAKNTTIEPVVATITVTPTYTNGGESCEGTPVDFTIKVNPTPTISSAATKTICDSTDLDYDITSATTGTTFTWTVSETTAPTGGSITGFTADATGTNSSINDVLVNSGTSPGEVTYTITPTGPATTNCPGIPFDLVVTVNPDPILTATPDVATFCSGGTTSIALSSTTSGVTYYYDAPIISGSAGNITGGTARTSPGNTNDITDTLVNTTAEIQTATYTVYAMYDGCVSSTPETVVITVNPVPVLTTGLTEGLCVDNLYTATANLDLTTSPSMAGALFTYGAPTLSGGAGDLTGGTARTTASSDNITDTFINTTDIAQTATYSVTPIAPSDLGGCSGEPKTVVITIYPRSEITSSLAEQVCSNYPFTYTITSNVVGTTFEWSRAAVAGISNASVTDTGSIINETLVNTTASTINVEYILTPTGDTSCAGTPSTLVVSVNPTPAVTPNLSQAICSGSTANLVLTSTPAVSGTTFTWPEPTTEGSFGTITGGTARTTGSTSPITDVLVNTTNVPLTLVYLVTPISTLGCVGTPTEVKITVNPIPTVSSDTTKEICNNDNVDYSPTSKVSGVTYTWTAALTSGTVTGFTTVPDSGATINDVLVNSGTTQGEVTYTITPTGPYSTNCEGTPFDFVVTINPIPDVIATPITETICDGDTTDIDLTTTITGTTVSYSWTAALTSGTASGYSAGSGNTISETLINSSTLPAIVTYTITPTIGTVCAGSPITVDITVNPSPSVISGTPVQGSCALPIGSIELIGLPSGNWTINQAGTTANSYTGSGSTYTVNSLASGSYNFTVTNDDGCTSSASSNIIINNIICSIVDNFSTTPVDEVLGGIAGDVTANDTLNGTVVSDSAIEITLDAADGIIGLTIDSNGNIIVPAGTSEGTYVIDYTICEVVNPSNCSSNSATIVVSDAGTPLAVNDGTYIVDEDSTINRLDWSGNDTLIDGATLSS